MNQALLTNEVLDVCVNFFFTNLYPTQPILERNKVREAIARMYEDAEAYVFVVSLCAYVLLITLPSTSDMLTMTT